ncbi:hypothetical protein D3273_20640 [Lichenibacterium minor]|uniref:Uncharacterized protein n=1 Tax=Lichenibacterium minor TaxID=2316528 RepID=A0A4Q2U1E5_9HYPH|nr:hypothetical protein [Lichenibacterium minor]RYC30102.1 hypothetical protein D3273_20640 [Lichenibacterium minor]
MAVTKLAWCTEREGSRGQPKRGQVENVALSYPSPFLIASVDVLKDGDPTTPGRVRAAACRHM